jgi:hypothetical protein
MKPTLVVLIVILALAGPSRGAAQSAAESSRASYGVRLHVGMWTMHLSDLGGGLESNWLVAVTWRGVYGGTFVNSFGRRSFAGGIERPLLRSQDHGVAAGLGYRFGLVTGYDERFLGLASRLPALPMLQLMGDVAVGRTGVELAWVAKVATMGPHLRLAD